MLDETPDRAATEIDSDEMIGGAIVRPSFKRRRDKRRGPVGDLRLPVRSLHGEFRRDEACPNLITSASKIVGGSPKNRETARETTLARSACH